MYHPQKAGLKEMSLAECQTLRMINSGLKWTTASVKAPWFAYMYVHG